MDEEVDIDPELRKWVADIHARLDRVSHYDLLGVRPGADIKEVKRAYMRLAGMIHPDRFLRKRLGRYKPMMEAIFARVSDAHETLRVPERRAAYDAELAEAPAQAGPAAPKAPVDPRVAAERQKAMDALKQRFAASRGDAKHLVDAAKRAQALGDIPGALDAYKKARLAAPNDAAIAEAIRSLEGAANERLVESHAKKAALEERFGRWAEAAASWQKVVEARPTDPDAQARLANALARAGR